MEGGELLIRCFLPESLLKDFDIEKIDMDTFLQYVAKAQYIRKMWKSVIQAVWENEENGT